MTNQLIQKSGKPPIVKTETEIVYTSIITSEKRLSDGFDAIAYPRGAKAFDQLKEEHDNLQEIFNSGGLNNSLVDVDKIKKLTDSLYSQGLKLLSSALETARGLTSTNAEQIEAELADLESELETCSPTLKPIIMERIEKNKGSIKAVKGYKDRVDELLCEVGLCRDSIREIRLELPELMSHKPQDEYDKIMMELDARIALAQRVKAEYVKQGL